MQTNTNSPGAAASGINDARPNAARPADQRHRVYDSMSDSLNKGLQLGGEITQGLKQADLFQIVAPADLHGAQHAQQQQHAQHAGVMVIPKLKPLPVPVRAVVLPLLDQEAASEIHEAAAGQLTAVLGEGSIWWQDASLYHATVYHASTHGVRDMRACCPCKGWGGLSHLTPQISP